MPAWLLRVLAVLVSAASMAGSTGYVLTHPRNPAAPLQPAVVDPVEADEPPLAPVVPTPRPTPARASATPSPSPSAAPASSSPAPQAVVATLPPTPAPTARPTSTPTPTLRLAPAVRATQLPKITTTHTS